MKRHTIAPQVFGALLTAFGFLASCQSPVLPQLSPAASLNLTVTETSSRTLAPDLAGLTASYRAVLSRSGSADIVRSFAGTSTSISSVPVGIWNLAVEGLNASSQVVAAGSSSVTITELGPNNASVDLGFIQDAGQGGVKLTFQWPDAAGVAAVELSFAAGAFEDLSAAVTAIDGARKQLVFTKIPQNAGSPLLIVRFKSASGMVLASVVESVWVFQNVTTERTVVLAANEFNAAPQSPSGLAAEVLSSSSVQLTWTDNSSVESAYLVSRSLSPSGPFAPIGTALSSNSSNFTDTGLSASATYYYQVAAQNSFGTSFAASVSASTLSNGVGEAHPQSGVYSPVDVNAQAAGLGWDGASWPLGARFNGTDLEVAVYSKNASKVLLEIYTQATGAQAQYDYWMEKGADNVWRTKIKDAPVNTLYAFRAWGPNWPYDVNWTRGHSALGFLSDVDTAGNRFNPNKVLYDPYAKELSHDKETPAMAAAGDSGAIYGSGGADAGTGQTYSGPLGGNQSKNRRDLNTAVWAPKAVAIQDTTPFGTKPAIAEKDGLIYETHVRGLTAHPSAANLDAILSGIEGFDTAADDYGVPDAYRGTYKGAGYLAKYLKALGYTTVEFLPVHETANDTQPLSSAGGNYWGYMTYGYFAPDRHYSYDKSLGGPTKEFKEMVKAFHDQGLEVYIDVVYNHTGEGGNWDTSKAMAELTSMRGLDNAEYYALVDTDKASYWETTGCGNNLYAANAPVRQLILDSLKYWRDVLGVDGFRFDLAPVLGRGSGPSYNFSTSAQTLTEIASQIGSGADIVAEAWDTQWPGGYQVSNFPAGWGEWNGLYRDAVRKFIKGGGNKSSGYPSFTDVFHGSYGPLDRSSGNTHTGFNDQGGPHKSVNFITAHDGFTLVDAVSYNDKNNALSWPFGPSDGGSTDNDSWDFGADKALRRQALRNFWAVQMFSRGVPMTVYGDEFARTQNGNNNPYNIDSVATWNNYDMINTDSPHTVSTGNTAIGTGSQSGQNAPYNDNFGTDTHVDSKNTLFLFAQFLMNLRRSEPALRSDSYNVPFYYSKADGTELSNTDRSVRIQIDGSTVAGGSDYLLCINTWTSSVDFTLPPPDSGHAWARLVDTSAWAEANDNHWSEAAAFIPGAGTYGVSAWSLAVFKALPTVGAPTLSPSAGTFKPLSAAPLVTFASTTAGASFQYTTDGSDPQSSATSVVGSSCQIPQSVGSTTLKVYAFKSGMPSSSVVSGTYVVAHQDATLLITFKTGSNVENVKFPGDFNSWSLGAQGANLASSQTTTLTISSAVTTASIGQGASATALELKIVNAAPGDWSQQWSFGSWTKNGPITLSDSNRQIAIACDANDIVSLTVDVATTTLTAAVEARE